MVRFARVIGIVLLLTALIGNFSCKKSLGWESFERSMNARQNDLGSKFFKSIGQPSLSVGRFF